MSRFGRVIYGCVSGRVLHGFSVIFYACVCFIFASITLRFKVVALLLFSFLLMQILFLWGHFSVFMLSLLFTFFECNDDFQLIKMRQTSENFILEGFRWNSRDWKENAMKEFEERARISKEIFIRRETGNDIMEASEASITLNFSKAFEFIYNSGWLSSLIAYYNRSTAEWFLRKLIAFHERIWLITVGNWNSLTN